VILIIVWCCKNGGKVGKQVAEMFDLERINLKKLSELEVRKQYQIDTSNSFTALWNLNDIESITRPCKIVEENIRFPSKESVGLHEQKQQDPWFDEQSSQCLIHRKTLWLHDPNRSNVNILNNVRYSASRHYRKKKGEYLEAKMNELETNRKIKNMKLV
jgi:hypothetical protein